MKRSIKSLPVSAMREATYTVYMVFLVGWVFTTSCSNVDVVEDRVAKLTSVSLDEAADVVKERIVEYQARVTESPNDPIVVGELGMIYELHGFSEFALIAYELASELDANEFRWRYYQSLLLVARFDLNRAIEEVEKALEIDPEYGPGWLQKGKLLLDANRFEEALESFEHAETLTDDPYVYFGQAHAHMGMNDPAATIEKLSKAGVLREHVNAKRLHGNALIRLGERERGTALLHGLPVAELIRWNDPIAEQKGRHAVDHIIIELAKVLKLIQHESYDSALFFLRELRKDYPENRHVIYQLALTLELNGEIQEALQVLEEGIEQIPDYYVLRTTIASLLSSQGDYDIAINHLDKAIEIDPLLHWAYSQKAQLLMSQKKWMEASHLLDIAIGIKDDDADLYTYLGICMGFLNRWPEAANLFRLAISIDATHVHSYINLARAETFLKNEESALAALANARAHGASDAMLAGIESQRVAIKKMQIEVVNR